jgi:outer membrane protein assembly factor BamB
MRVVFAVCSLVALACSERPPPPGAGALETTPTGGATPGQAPISLSLPVIQAYPNGSVVTVEPKTCRVGLLRDGSVRWDHEMSGCGGLLETTVAADSTLYVRDQKSLTGFDPDGAQRWTVRLPDAPPPRALATPSALADSRVVLAATTKSVVVYDREGKVSLSFSPPSEEVLVTAPVGMKTEGFILMTSRAAYYLSATGDVRWRVAGQH